MLSISALSKEYVRVSVATTDAGAAVNPTTDTVTMAFVVPGVAPVSGDWKAASWETASGVYYARALIGPGGIITLTPGAWSVFVKVSDSPEVPVRNAGLLNVY